MVENRVESMDISLQQNLKLRFICNIIPEKDDKGEIYEYDHIEEIKISIKG